MSKGRTATVPDYPGKDPGPEEPVVGAKTDAGKKPVNKRKSVVVPADKPNPAGSATGEKPASSAVSGSAPGKPPSEKTPGSRAHSREEPDPQVPGREGDVF